MKKVVALFICFCLFVCCCPVKVYADVFSITQKIENVFYNIVQNKKIASFVKTIKSGWEKFKSWFSNLPGIKQYNESVYSGDNWKRAMNDMGGEYRQHLQKESPSAKLLREGKANWDNL